VHVPPTGLVEIVAKDAVEHGQHRLPLGAGDTVAQERPELREEWAARITDAHLLRVMRSDEIFTEVTAVYDNYVNALETGSVEALRAYARDLSERIVRRGVETDEVLGTVLLLRDVLARALFVRHQVQLGSKPFRYRVYASKPDAAARATSWTVR